MMLEQEIEKYLSGQTLCNCDSVSYRNIKNLILSFAEPREKRIAELEAQIEKMKCCENCAKRGHICVAEEMQGKLCGKNKDKWELRR